MIAALYSSRPKGAKDFVHDSHHFGWNQIERVFQEEMERAVNGLSRKVPGLKYAFVYRDNWTRLNVRPAKIMQVHVCCEISNINFNSLEVITDRGYNGWSTIKLRI